VRAVQPCLSEQGRREWAGLRKVVRARLRDRHGREGNHCPVRSRRGGTAVPTTMKFERQDSTDQIFAIKTWRYLRASMIGFVLAIFVGVGFERSKAPGCFQTSISAYYYTPVHGIFIGALVAVGTCLICLRGNTDAEDILLNLAGMFAPIVALVPTPGTGSCGSVLTTADNRDVNISNNMFVLLVVGAAGFVFLAVIAIVGRAKHGNWPPRLSLIGYALTLAVWGYAVVTFAWFRTFFRDTAHYSAAIAMFVCFLAVVILDAISYRVHQEPAVAAHPVPDKVKATFLSWRNPYAVIALVMIADAIGWGIVGLVFNWSHWIIWIEATLIALFAVFWGWQTSELWNKGLRGQAAPSGRSDAGVLVPPSTPTAPPAAGAGPIA
jgi:hypothetical protein